MLIDPHFASQGNALSPNHGNVACERRHCKIPDLCSNNGRVHWCASIEHCYVPLQSLLSKS